MAAALRKLLRSSSSRLEHKCEKQADIGSPNQAARRLLARACSSMGYRDATKVSPAESNNVPPAHISKKGPKGSAGVPNVPGAASSAPGGFLKPKKNNAFLDSSVAHARLVRTRRLMREFQDMSKQVKDGGSPIFTVELVDDNLYEWHVKLLKVDPDSELYRDMRDTNTPHILLNLTFPDNYPFAPPFMRVITPRIEKGFVMEGGAICMELLTPGGWASAYTIEAIVMQFSASLVKGQGRIAKKAKSGKDFSRKSAEASFRSLVKTHEKYGWVTPPLADG